jgi:uncharacterized membrane protein
MNKKLVSVLITLLVVLAIFASVVFLLGNLMGIARFQTDKATVLLRFGFVVLGLLIAFAVYLATRENKAWEVGTRQVVWMAIGAALYAVFSWLFNSSVFLVPSISQVALRPAIAIPMFFGYTFGPVVGFFTGAVGNMFGDALTGFGLSPQWSIANGLIGFIAGLPMLFVDKKKSLNLVLIIGAVLAVLAAGLYFIFPTLKNLNYYNPANDTFGETQITLLAGGGAMLVGLILVLISRFLPRIFPWVLGFLAGGFILTALFGFVPIPFATWIWIIIFLVGAIIGLLLSLRLASTLSKNEDVVIAVVWGMLGNILGIGFAAISDIWINGYSPAAAVVGEFLPAAGPNLIFAAILVPLLVVAYAAVQRQSGR